MDDVLKEEFDRIFVNGGPAYPCQIEYSNGSTRYFTGMTLRQWYAGKALPGVFEAAIKTILASEGEEVGIDHGMIAADAFDLADHMIATPKRLEALREKERQEAREEAFREVLNMLPDAKAAPTPLPFLANLIKKRIAGKA
jgi:hypothetical protein